MTANFQKDTQHYSENYCTPEMWLINPTATFLDDVSIAVQTTTKQQIFKNGKFL